MMIVTKKKTYDITKEEIEIMIEIITILKIFNEDQNNNSTKTMVISKSLNFLTNMTNLWEVIMSIIFLIVKLKLNLINFFQRLIL